jgi:hypothetical protein
MLLECQLQHCIVTHNRTRKHEKSSESTAITPSLDQLSDIQTPQSGSRGVFLLPFPRSQFRICRGQRNERVGQYRQTQNSGCYETIALRLCGGQVGGEEVGPARKQRQGRHGACPDGTHCLPLRQERFVRRVLDVAWDVHVRDEE